MHHVLRDWCCMCVFLSPALAISAANRNHCLFHSTIRDPRRFRLPSYCQAVITSTSPTSSNGWGPYMPKRMIGTTLLAATKVPFGSAELSNHRSARTNSPLRLSSITRVDSTHNGRNMPLRRHVSSPLSSIVSLFSVTRPLT